MRNLALLIPFVLAVGCKISEDEWPDKSSEAQCKFQERCDAAAFYYHYADVDECVSDSVALWEDYRDFYEEECQFSAENAKACLKQLDDSCKSVGREYEDVFASCFAVWDCDDKMDTDLGI